jgi:hypothetical protein
MPDRHLLRLDLNNFRDPVNISRLVQAQESLFVEKKSKVPADGLGPTIGSFANTLGGILLLGVDDSNQPVGFEPPGNADLADWVREKLRGELDPEPPFVADTFKYEGVPIGLIRVAESFDTPHITANGGVYVRVPAGRQPVTDHRTLLDLARRGDDAEREARERVDLRLPLIHEAFTEVRRIPGDEPGRNPPYALVWTLQGTPLSIPPALPSRAITLESARWASAACAEVLSRGESLNPPPDAHHEPKARGVVARGGSIATSEIADLAVDAGGVVAVRVAKRRSSAPLHLPSLADDYLLPLLTVVTTGLFRLGAAGRAALALNVEHTGELEVFVGSDQRGTINRSVIRLGAGVVIPADDDDLAAVSNGWMREIGREAGLPLWESEEAC